MVELLFPSSGDSFQPELYDFDHIHFDSNIMSPVAILYGALGTDCFREFHVALVQAAKEVCYCTHSRFSFTYKSDNTLYFSCINPPH